MGKNLIKAEHFNLLELQQEKLKFTLNSAPLEFTPGFEANAAVLTIPTPEGRHERFAIVEAPIMHAEVTETFFNAECPPNRPHGILPPGKNSIQIRQPESVVKLGTNSVDLSQFVQKSN